MPAFELARHIRDPVLEPLRPGVPDVGEPLREHRLGLARERAHSSIQLPREALGGVLAGRLHELREPLGGLVGVRRDSSVDGALELFDLAARHVLETCLDALSRIGLLALRLLAELSLAARQPGFQLLEGPAALGRMRFELAPNDPERVLERAVEIGAEPPHGRALLLTLGRAPLGVGGEAKLDLP